MLKSVPLLLSLVSMSGDFINMSFSPHLSHYLISNSLLNPPKTMIAQQKTLPTLREEGFLFQFQECKKDSNNLICFFTVKNELPTRELSIDGRETRIVDSAGNQFRATAVSLGDREHRGLSNYAKNRMPKNVPIKGSATFHRPTTDIIVLFDVYAYLPGIRKSFHVEFVNN